MAVFITPREEVEAYYADDSLNQSELKKLENGLDSYLTTKKKEEENTDTPDKLHFKIGKAIDTLLTGGPEEFDELYYASPDDMKLSLVEVSIVEHIFATAVANHRGPIENMGPLLVFENYIEHAFKDISWQPTWKVPTKVQKVIDFGSLYFEALKETYGRTVLTGQDYRQIQAVVESVKTNPLTAGYFDFESLAENPLVHAYYQLPIYFEIEGVKCKALLDLLMVHFNEEGQVLAVCPFDFKSMDGHTVSFPYSMKRFRYDIQGAWYTDALRSPTAVFPEGFPNLSGAVLDSFTFIVESKTNPGKPLLFQMSQDLIEIGRNGYYNHNINKLTNKGYNTLFRAYQYHTENGWTMEKFIRDSGGVLTLDWEGIQEDNGY